jgi:hypothetical protein
MAANIIQKVIDGIRCFYDVGAGEWHIECTTCDNYYTWKPAPPVPVIGVRATQPQTWSATTCPNKLPSSNDDCRTVWRIQYDRVNPGQNQISHIRKSGTPEMDRLWFEYGMKKITDSLDSLDKRAEYMITTIAGLVAVTFGVILAFDLVVKGNLEIVFKIAPQGILAISAIPFAISHFPMKKYIYPDSPEEMKATYTEWLNYKHYWQKWGYFTFVIGLFLIFVATMFSLQTPEPDVQNLNGTLNIILKNP